PRGARSDAPPDGARLANQGPAVRPTGPRGLRAHRLTLARPAHQTRHRRRRRAEDPSAAPRFGHLAGRGGRRRTGAALAPGARGGGPARRGHQGARGAGPQTPGIARGRSRRSGRPVARGAHPAGGDLSRSRPRRDRPRLGITRVPRASPRTLHGDVSQFTVRAFARSRADSAAGKSDQRVCTHTGRGRDTLDIVIPMRRCCRPGCKNPAVATLTYVYSDSTAVVGPLATVAEPHSWDLCETHASRITAPKGWELVRHEG